MYILNASLINFTTISVNFNENSGINIKNFIIKNGELTFIIDSFDIHQNAATLYLKGEINIKRECYIYYENSNTKISYGKLFSSEEFHDKYYTERELGVKYSKDYTTFTLWSPAASYINLLIYESGDPSVPETPCKYKMIEENGLWTVKIKGNYKGYFYTYQIKVYDEMNEVVDPYARAVGVNGHRGAIIDLRDTDPKDFNNDHSPVCKNFTDAVIYESSVRDISIHPDSGVRHKGKFLGLNEKNTYSSKGVSTGLQHILELGVTHVQLMPIFDFSNKSIDEKNPYKYNWGYDPQNYNVPEGSYSTDPYLPLCRIIELKKMIQHLHRNGLSIIMDVVFNHLFHNTDNNFHKIFPGYYFRYDELGKLSNGSGCGNDTASERSMMRRFIIDSVLYWAKEYHLDGFRIDLMGIHDVTTINMLREVLDKLNRKIMLYGEGWNLDTMLPDSKKATIYNADKLPRVGHFNDIIRDTLRGSVFSAADKGYVSGKKGLDSLIRYCVTGCTLNINSIKGTFNSPEQSINYVSAHDNHTLWDKLQLSCTNASEDELKSMSKLADGIVLTSQGISFIHSGAEFCRTKSGISNSYNSSDNINRLDWNRKLKFIDIYEYYKGLIQLRKSHPAFRMENRQQIKDYLLFLNENPQNTVVFILRDHANGDCWKDIVVIYNPNNHIEKVNIPDGKWNVVVDKNNSGTETLRSFSANFIEVEGISINVLYRN